MTIAPPSQITATTFFTRGAIALLHSLGRCAASALLDGGKDPRESVTPALEGLVVWNCQLSGVFSS